MTFASPIGISDFPKLREARAYYVDKTHLITELVTRQSEVALFPRPRRFGKTLNVSMLRTFFEPSDEDRVWMFEDLAVWQCEACREHFQKHPVIDLSFKGVKSGSWPPMIDAIQGVIAQEFKRHGYLREQLAADDLVLFSALQQRSSSLAVLKESIALLSQWLEAHHGAKPIILLDEYDVPIQASFQGGYYQEAMLFFRDFVTMAFKDNEHLYRGVLTGILRVSKESMFSGANNIDVYSIFNRAYSTCFGFTQQEVDTILEHLDVPDAAQHVREWYNGYRFAGTTIYNPWSVLKYAADPEEGPVAHWLHSGSDHVLRDLVLGRGSELTEDIKKLMSGEGIERVVTDYMVLEDLQRDLDAVWNLLLLSGYLTVRNERRIEGELHAELVIPNKEVQTMYRKDIQHWLESATGAGGSGLRELFEAMFVGDEKLFGILLGEVVRNTLSYHDVPRPSKDDTVAFHRLHRPERVYQAFVLGMLVHFRSTHFVKSNRESGFGRYDVALIPREPGHTGVLFELKTVTPSEWDVNDKVDGKRDDKRDGKVAKMLDEAMTQLDAQDYASELEERGAKPIVKWGVVFDGKRVWVKVKR